MFKSHVSLMVRLLDISSVRICACVLYCGTKETSQGFLWWQFAFFWLGDFTELELFENLSNYTGRVDAWWCLRHLLHQHTCWGVFLPSLTSRCALLLLHFILHPYVLFFSLGPEALFGFKRYFIVSFWGKIMNLGRMLVKYQALCCVHFCIHCLICTWR